MRRKHLSAISLAILATLALTATALAGEWATVEAAGPTDGQAAGSATIIELEVLQHGVTPVSWPRITVSAANATTSDIVAAVATPVAGETGRYTATLTFPSEGSWTLSYASPDLFMEGTETLAVSAPVVAATAVGANAATAAVDPALVVGLGLVVVAFLLVFGALVVRDRRADRAKQPVTVGS